MSQRKKPTSQTIKTDDRVVDDEVVNLMFWELMQAPEWMMDGNCVRYDIDNPEEIIDPIKDADFISEKLCPDCTVKEFCNSWSKKFDITKGVFGGVNYNIEDS